MRPRRWAQKVLDIGVIGSILSRERVKKDPLPCISGSATVPWGVSVASLTSALIRGDVGVISAAMTAMKPSTISFGRRRLLRMIAPSLLESGLSGNRALSLLKGVGMGYRREDFLKDFTAYGREPIRVGNYLSQVQDGETYDLSMARKSTENFGSEYTGVARVDWRDPLTGELHEQYITIAMTEGMTDEDVGARIERDMVFWYRTDGEEWAGAIESWAMEDLAYNSDWADPYAGLLF